MKTKINIILLLVVALFFYRCEEFFAPETDLSAGFYDEDVVSISKYIMNNPENFSRFQTILEKSKMFDALNSYNPEGVNFTLFLPTNTAIEKFISESTNYESFDDLVADEDYITALARYHVVMQEFKTLDFPYGALPETTASNDYLTISYVFGYDSLANEILYDSTVYKVNGVASIRTENIELVNGIVHVIDEVLEPITLTSYEWLLNEPGFSLITQAFQITGLADTLGLYVTGDSAERQNTYTLLVEHDSIYQKNHIYTIDDLITSIVSNPLDTDYSDPNNPLYQFAAYHILENQFFLDEIEAEATNYNTYANYPVNLSSALDIIVNKGSSVFDTIIINNDTSFVDYTKVLYTVSNVLTKNGAIHFVNQMLELYKPTPSLQTFQFLNEEPVLNQLKNEVGEHPFFDDEEFTALKWEGVDLLEYIKSASSSEEANQKDYIRIDGDFIIRYTLPKIMAGTYAVFLKANAQDYQNATIQVFIDGKRLGSSYSLGSGGDPYDELELGKVTFLTSKTHLVEVRTLIPGKFEWDYIQFDPNQ